MRDAPDDALLQGIGRLSASIVEAVRAAEGVVDGLDRLAAPGARLLDVGTGTGWLAIALARTYPELHVVGIDIFESALDLARRNVGDAGLDGRVELRLQDAADLGGGDEYDVIWLPLPFLPSEVVPRVLDACRQTLRTGGWLLPGTFADTGERMSALLMALRTVRTVAAGLGYRSNSLYPCEVRRARTSALQAAAGLLQRQPPRAAAGQRSGPLLRPRLPRAGGAEGPPQGHGRGARRHPPRHRGQARAHRRDLHRGHAARPRTRPGRLPQGAPRSTWRRPSPRRPRRGGNGRDGRGKTGPRSS